MQQYMEWQKGIGEGLSARKYYVYCNCLLQLFIATLDEARAC